MKSIKVSYHPRTENIFYSNRTGCITCKDLYSVLVGSVEDVLKAVAPLPGQRSVRGRVVIMTEAEFQAYRLNAQGGRA